MDPVPQEFPSLRLADPRCIRRGTGYEVEQPGLFYFVSVIGPKNRYVGSVDNPVGRIRQWSFRCCSYMGSSISVL